MTPLASWSGFTLRSSRLFYLQEDIFIIGCVVKKIGRWMVQIKSRPRVPESVRVCYTLFCATLLSKLSYMTAPKCLKYIYCYCKGDIYYNGYTPLHGCTKRLVQGSENSAYTLVYVARECSLKPPVTLRCILGNKYMSAIHGTQIKASGADCVCNSLKLRSALGAVHQVHI